jgi:S1-C subfamily serine protease
MSDQTNPHEAPPSPSAEWEPTAPLPSSTPAAPPASSVEPPPVAGWSAPAQPAGDYAPAPFEETVPPPSPPYAQDSADTAPPHRSGVGAAVLVAILVAFVVGAFTGLGGGFIGAQLALHSQQGALQPSNITVVPSKTDEPVAAAAAAAVPSVVNIDVTEGTAAGGQSGLPGTHPSVPVSGNGSGVAFRNTADGGTYILTNNHVVTNATAITVRSPSGKSWTGKVIGSDADNDIAVVEVPASLPIIKLGDSKNLIVGQTVVAIGSPYGLEHSVTAGVVSALGRSLADVSGGAGLSETLVDTIQTDAAINPGNSGGALVDRTGRLVGVNTAIYSQSGSAAGIGFAVPVDTAIRVADQLINGGKVTHPFVGVAILDITPALATQKKLAVQQGALVDSVFKGLGADKAGIRAGDIVTAVDGVPIASATDFVAHVRKHAIGATVSLTVLRSGKTSVVKVQVSDRPADASTPPPSGSAPSTP